jgi:hypothetical protein
MIDERMKHYKSGMIVDRRKHPSATLCITNHTWAAVGNRWLTASAIAQALLFLYI